MFEGCGFIVVFCLLAITFAALGFCGIQLMNSQERGGVLAGDVAGVKTEVFCRTKVSS